MHGTPLAKQILWFLLDRSKRLKKEVYFTFTEGKDYTKEEIRGVGHSVGDMQSCNSTTHINEVMAAIGTDFTFSVHYGHFDGEYLDTSGQFGERPRSGFSYTIWLAKKYYSRSSEKVSVSRARLEAIDLRRPGLCRSEDQWNAPLLCVNET